MATLSATWRRFGVMAGTTGLGLAAFATFSAKAAHAQSAQQEPALSPKEFRAFTLERVEKISHNTSLFRFKLEDGQPLGLTVASCLMLEGPLGPDGNPAVRPYTPTTGSDVTGHFDLVIKGYETGVVSKWMHSVKVGEKVNMKGPFKKLDITPNMKKEIGMIAGGTGITPMYQCLTELLRHPEDQTKLTLLFANVSEADILLRKELDALAQKHPRLTIHYVLSKKPAGFKGFEGHVNKDLIVETMPKPSADSMVFVCGPPGMMAAVSGDKAPDRSQGEVAGVLADLGYTKDMVYKF